MIEPNVPTLGEEADLEAQTLSLAQMFNLALNRFFAKRVLYDAFYFFYYFLKMFVYSK